MAPASADQPQISRRLKNALIADLVMEDLTREGDHWLADTADDEHDWTNHLARQLGIRDIYGASGLHETLMLILWQLDEALNDWPPLHDAGTCRDLANIATKDLSPIETYASLLAGPVHWRSQKIESVRVDKLGNQLRLIIEKALAAELARVIAKWVDWDVRRLNQRRRDAVEERSAAKAKADAAERPPPSARRRSGDKFIRPFTPPGKT